MSNSAIYTFNVSRPTILTKYVGNIDNIGHAYPWHLKLANGLTCNWKWWNKNRSSSPSWECNDSSSGADIILPADYGDNPVDFNSILEIDPKNDGYTATNLSQSQQDSWTILIEENNNQGLYERATVTEAWY